MSDFAARFSIALEKDYPHMHEAQRAHIVLKLAEPAHVVELTAALVVMVEKCAATLDDFDDTMYAETWPERLRIAKEAMRLILPAETVAQVERERKRLQLDAKLELAMSLPLCDLTPMGQAHFAEIRVELKAALEAELKAAVEG